MQVASEIVACVVVCLTLAVYIIMDFDDGCLLFLLPGLDRWEGLMKGNVLQDTEKLGARNMPWVGFALRVRTLEEVCMPGAVITVRQALFPSVFVCVWRPENSLYDFSGLFLRHSFTAETIGQIL